MKKKWLWWIGLLILLLTIGGYISLRLYQLGAFFQTAQVFEGNCAGLAAVPGPEDLEIDPEAERMFFISYDRWKADSNAGVRGEIYVLDLTQEKPEPKALLNGALEDFYPHGMSLWRGDSTYLFCINHRSDGVHAVEVFRWEEKDSSLIHLETFTDPTFISPNDLVAVGPHSFYLSNDSRSREQWVRSFDTFFQLKRGNVIFYDGKSAQLVIEQLSFPNGLAFDSLQQRLYVAETVGGILSAYQIKKEHTSLALIKQKRIGIGLDNLSISENGDIWLAQQPNLLALGQHLKHADKTAPAKVIQVIPTEEDWLVKEVFSDNGDKLSGLSVAAFWNGRVYVGAVCRAQLLACQAPNTDLAMQLNGWKAQGSLAEIKQETIFYQEAGTGETLLLLHAYPTASWGWHRIWEPLTQQYHCIAADLPGSGFSSKLKEGDYSIGHLADVLEDLLAAKEIDSLHVLAHAYGVSIAQELLARQEAALEQGKSPRLRLRSIAYINGGMFPEVTRTTGMQKLLLSPMGKLISRNFPTPYGAFQKNFSATFGPESRPTPEEMQAYWQLLTWNEGHKRVPEVIQYLRERKAKRELWVAAMQQTQSPQALIVSTADKLIGEPVLQRWQELLPRATYYTLDFPSGHYPPLEDPDGVMQAYLQFRGRPLAQE